MALRETLAQRHVEIITTKGPVGYFPTQPCAPPFLPPYVPRLRSYPQLTPFMLWGCVNGDRFSCVSRKIAGEQQRFVPSSTFAGLGRPNRLAVLHAVRAKRAFR
jgi:hypothetical protein